MGYSAQVIADSVRVGGSSTSKIPSHRLTTLLVSYPRFVHAEHMRHRMGSYCVASSRARPVESIIEEVMTDPVLPIYWGQNQKGMSARRELSPGNRVKAEYRILKLRDQAVAIVKELIHLNSDFPEETAVGLHKQIANRYLEPWMWVTVLMTATEWDNFFFLRCHPDAQPEIRHIAELMRDAMAASTPVPLIPGEWHVPFIRQEDRNDAVNVWIGGGYADSPNPQWTILKQVSVGRCARTSYLTHLGTRDLREDIRLHGDLLSGAFKLPPEPMHLSPFEHVATPLSEDDLILREETEELRKQFPCLLRMSTDRLTQWLNTTGNLVGWKSYRSEIPNEEGPRS